MNPATITLLLAAVGGFIVAILLYRARTLFLVDLAGGRAIAKRGRPPGPFLEACEDICRIQRITKGQISAVHRHGTVALQFSRHIPKSAHQAFRNIWTPPPAGGGGGGGMRASG